MAQPNLLCDTAGMDRKTWLAARRHGPDGTIPYTLGGSDVSVVFGMSPWNTPLELWREKAGLAVADDEANAGQKEMGHLLEPIVAHWYGKKSGNQVIADTGLYQHAGFPFALANLDYRFIDKETGMPGILECKTTTYHNAGEWADDQIPYHYELQGRFYMAVMDLEICDFCCMWGNNPESDIVIRRIHRDRDIEAMIFDQLSAFIKSLQDKIPPTMEGVVPKLALAALARIYGKSVHGVAPVEFGKKQEKPLRRIAKLQVEVSELKEIILAKEAEIDAHSVQIAEAMKEFDFGELVLEKEKLVISYKTRITKRPNSELLKTKYPAVYTDVLKASESRRLKVSIEPL